MEGGVGIWRLGRGCWRGLTDTQGDFPMAGESPLRTDWRCWEVGNLFTRLAGGETGFGASVRMSGLPGCVGQSACHENEITVKLPRFWEFCQKLSCGIMPSHVVGSIYFVEIRLYQPALFATA